MAFDEFTQYIGNFFSSILPSKDEAANDPSEKESMLQGERKDHSGNFSDESATETDALLVDTYKSQSGGDNDSQSYLEDELPEGEEEKNLMPIQEGRVLKLPRSQLSVTDSEGLSEATSNSDLSSFSDVTSSKSLPIPTRLRVNDEQRQRLLPRSGSENLSVYTRDRNHRKKITLTQHYSPRGYYGRQHLLADISWVHMVLLNLKKKSTSYQNSINSKRERIFFPTEQCKNDENWIRNKEVMTFWNFTFFRKTLLDQSLWIFKWASWWCHPLTIFYSFHIQKWQKSHISAVRI